MGTSVRCRRIIACVRDHPHACGDKDRWTAPRRNFGGSSPRVWGQGTIACVRCRRTRIIPTRVGTRSFLYCTVLFPEDHPHACGDKFYRQLSKVCNQGSSPRVWGQVSIMITVTRILRIIPTRVGTRLKKSRKIAVLQNQPLRFPLTFHRSFV